MRKALATIVVALMAVLGVTDRISCPDGCTTSHEHESTESPQAGACALCLQSVETQVVTEVATPAAMVTAVPTNVATFLPSAPRVTLVPPPKSF